MRIAIHGIKGSFHHIATEKYFGKDIEIVEGLTFSSIPKQIKNGTVDLGVMAVEESNIGSIQANYALIDKYNLDIAGEIYLPMKNDLLAYPNQKISDIKEVVSNYILFNQCAQFLKENSGLKMIEVTDTAAIAKKIKAEKLKGIAAIGDSSMGKIYGLEPIAKNVHGDNLNLMRFFVLRKDRIHTDDDYLNNKASLKLITKDEIGSLARALNLFSEYNISLSKIESLPLKNENQDHAFYVDLTFSDYHLYCKCLLKLEEQVTLVKILGEYKSNK